MLKYVSFFPVNLRQEGKRKLDENRRLHTTMVYVIPRFLKIIFIYIYFYYITSLFSWSVRSSSSSDSTAVHGLYKCTQHVSTSTCYSGRYDIIYILYLQVGILICIRIIQFKMFCAFVLSIYARFIWRPVIYSCLDSHFETMRFEKKTLMKITNYW